MTVAATRQNRRLSISWAKKFVRANIGMITSDLFFAPYENVSQIKNAIKTLRKSKIEVFVGPGDCGALLVHRNDPRLNITGDNGGYYETRNSDGQSNITPLFSLEYAIDNNALEVVSR